MTGPEHYAEAEVHLDDAQDAEEGSDLERYHLAAAQVHATLALAAATAGRLAIEEHAITGAASEWDDAIAGGAS